MSKTRRKLIEVALPLDAINKASAREKSIRHGHPSTLHLWWARRPLAAARAVIFSQIVDDPSACPEEFPTVGAQDKERHRLFGIIEELVKWENSTNEVVLENARNEVWKSWRRTCADNADNPRAKELFDPGKLPAFHDPFAGGGALPLEAQRLGLEAYASDLNPVAVLINKAMIEIPPRFAGRPPVNLAAREQKELLEKVWRGAEGLAGDVRYYGKWMRDEAEKRIGHLYPKVEVTAEMAKDRPDLNSYVGRELTVIAWLWARTVRSPNPAFAHVHVPLASNFMLSTRKGKEAYVKPVIKDEGYRFFVNVGAPKDAEAAKKGTKLSRGAHFQCLMSGAPIAADYIRAEGLAGRIGAQLMAIVAEGDRRRVYLSPTDAMAAVASEAQPEWRPDVEFFQQALGFRVGNYGMTKWSDLFTNRQLVALTTFADLVQVVYERVRRDSIAAGVPDCGTPLRDGGAGATAYAEAVGVYLAFALSKVADLANTIVTWRTDRESSYHLFSRQAIPMSWDYCELNTLLSGTGSFVGAAGWTAESIEGVAAGFGSAFGDARQANATNQEISRDKVVSTDPPYYDNIGYADLSDFFYVWLRRSLRPFFPGLLATLAVPKAEELVATPDRHGGKEKAGAFYLESMTQAMNRLTELANHALPVTIYYAFKQSEGDGEAGTRSTGWETFLDAVIRAGFAISGTWPMRTELGNRRRGIGSNALASSIVLVCRRRSAGAPTATHREFLTALKAELPVALAHLQRSNIAPVDLAQAAIGPGMAIYTRHSKVLEADDSPMTVRGALQLINLVVDEVFSEEEQDFDPDTRFAVTWYESNGFEEGAYGEAETLANARGVAVAGVQDAGIIKSAAGKVRLIKRTELPEDWDPATDDRLTMWEATQHLIKRLEDHGEHEAADLLARLGTKAGQARSLAYRLYTSCERKKWAEEAQAYNGLVLAWPELEKLAGEAGPSAEPETQAGLFE